MKENIEKKVYEAPVVEMIQVILEDVIAVSGPKETVSGGLESEWTDEDLNSDNVILF